MVTRLIISTDRLLFAISRITQVWRRNADFDGVRLLYWVRKVTHMETRKVFLYSVQVLDKEGNRILKESFRSLVDAMTFFSIVDESLNHENTSIFLTH